MLLKATFLLTLLFLPVHADPPAPPVTDPTLVGDHYRQLLARPEFTETGEPDINSRFRDMLSQWFLQFGARLGEFKYANRMPAFEAMLVSFLAAASVASIVYIMVRLTRRRREMELERPVETSCPFILRPPEFYDDEIRRAVDEARWHIAWLAAWRQFLSRLEQRQLVDADRTRTNREYLARLRTRTIPDPALELLDAMVDTYDRFIYGHLSIGEPEWTLFHRQIGEATLLLHLEDKKPRTARSEPT